MIEYANIIIFSAAVFALIWAYINYVLVKKVEMKSDAIQVNELQPEEIEKLQQEKL